MRHLRTFATLVLLALLGSTSVSAQTQTPGASSVVTVRGTAAVTQSTSPWVVTFTMPSLVAGTALIGHVICDSGCGSTIPGQQAMANSAPVVIASNQSTVPVSVATLPLPTNAAIETGGNIAATLAQLTDVYVEILNLHEDQTSGNQITQITGPSGDKAVVTALGRLSVQLDGTGVVVPVTGTFWQATQPISAAALPLPSGASTEATLALIKAKTDNLDVALSTRTKPADAQHVILDSGTTTVTQATGTNLHVVMDSGAAAVTCALCATSALQGVTDADDASIATGQTAAVGLALNMAYDGSVWRRLTFGTAGVASAQVLTIQGIASMTKLLVTPDSVALPANQSVNMTQVGGSTLTIGQQLAAASLPVILPAATVTTLTPPAAISGFALEAGHLATIDTSTARIPAQGQALAAASLPVVLTAAQITTLTPLSTVTTTPPANASTNVAQLAGTTTDTNSGNKSAGTLRIVEATDTPLLTKETMNNVSISSNESVAAPTAATWYVRRQWALPASAHFVPYLVWAAVTTAGSRSMVAIVNNMGNLNLSTNTFTAGNSVASPFFYSRLFGCVTTVMSATADTITPTYTDDQGNSQAATGVAFASASPVGNCFEFPLATSTPASALDTGVRAVTAAVDTAAPTGVVTFFGVNVLLDTVGPASTLEQVHVGGGSFVGELNANEQIMLLLMQAATTAQQRSIGISGTLR